MCVLCKYVHFIKEAESMAATVIRINNCTVRIHGEPDAEKLRATTEAFLKKVERVRKNGK